MELDCSRAAAVVAAATAVVVDVAVTDTAVALEDDTVFVAGVVAADNTESAVVVAGVVAERPVVGKTAAFVAVVLAPDTDTVLAVAVAVAADSCFLAVGSGCSLVSDQTVP